MKSLKQIIAGTMIAGGLFFNLGCEEEIESAVPEVITPNYDSVIVQAEKPLSFSGVGRAMSRSTANQARSWLTGNGSSANYNFNLETNSTYDVVARYSNDGSGDFISLLFNNNFLNNFWTSSTGSGGTGWNNFTYSPTYQITTGEQTNNALSIGANTDSFGVEIDSIYFTRQK